MSTGYVEQYSPKEIKTRDDARGIAAPRRFARQNHELDGGRRLQ
jgi:hypothetical protein